MSSKKKLEKERREKEKAIQEDINNALSTTHSFAGQGGDFEFAHEHEVVYEGDMLGQLPLGIAFADYTTKKEKSILIAGVKPDSLAGRESNLEIGMVLKRVQGKKIAGLGFKAVMDLIKAAKREGTQLRLQFSSYDEHMNGSKFGEASGAKASNPLMKARRARKFGRLQRESNGILATAVAAVAALSPRKVASALSPRRVVAALSPRRMISPRSRPKTLRNQDLRVGCGELTPRRFRSPLRWQRHKQLKGQKADIDSAIQNELLNIETAVGSGGDFEFENEQEFVFEGDLLASLPLGIAFADYTAKKEKAILVAGLKPGSMASRRGGIEVGMVLKRVQRKKVIGLSFEQIMTMIKTAKASGTELRLQFATYDAHMSGSRFGDDASSSSSNSLYRQARKSRKFNRLKKESDGMLKASRITSALSALSPRKLAAAMSPRRVVNALSPRSRNRSTGGEASGALLDSHPEKRTKKDYEKLFAVQNDDPGSPVSSTRPDDDNDTGLRLELKGTISTETDF